MIILHLSWIFSVAANALPIFNNTSNTHNNTMNLKANGISRENLANMSKMIADLKVSKDFNLTHVVKELKGFGVNNLNDDKHLEGFPLDRQGGVNPDFHKEIFLGHHDQFEKEIQENPEKRKQKLEEIFNQADGNNDQYLTHEELTNHVLKNVQSHLKEAKDRNSQLFILIDTNQNGKITWQEYAALFVQFHHMNQSDIRDLNDVDFIQESFDENLQRELLRIRFHWIEADHDYDNELNIDEFLHFRHPEMSSTQHKYMVDGILGRLDTDDDLKLNLTEFLYSPDNAWEIGKHQNKDWAELDKLWSEQQKMEFVEMDEDKDGFLSREELIRAYDPLNRSHINIQIRRLFSKVDDSPKDNRLSLDEIQKHADVFTDMRLLNFEKSLHDEM